MTSHLFSPIRLANLELENRIVIAPMCQYSADNGRANDWHFTHLGMLANSGASLLVVEATGVEPAGRITHGCLGLYSDECETALIPVLAHCRRIGHAKLAIQLAHAGRKASAQRPWEGGLALKGNEKPWEAIAPSAIPFGPGWPVPREMTVDDMARVREGFVRTAQRSLRLGFDAIELHMAHGYLLHSFVSPVSNRRSDAYGGSLAARMRFPMEVMQAVRAVVPRGVPLGARITGSDWQAEGITPDDAVALAAALKSAGLDYICVSSGGVSAESRVKIGPGYQVPFAEEVRRKVGLPTRAVGLIVNPKQAEQIITDGQADMIALARAVLDDPRWGWHAAQALGAEPSLKRPPQYQRIASELWPGVAYRV